MNFNEMISTEASPFQYTEFGLLKSVEVQGELFFPASASAKIDRKSTRLNSSHKRLSRMPSSA